MENNKILITLHFALDDSPSAPSRVMEIMVLRDVYFKQLLESIRYGLQKYRKIEMKSRTKDDSVLSYAQCLDIFNQCYQDVIKDSRLNQEYWNSMVVSMYDRKTLEKTENSHTIFDRTEMGVAERIVLLKSDEDKRLCDLGFISATRLIFFKKVGKGIHEVETSRIIAPFNPTTENAEIKFPRFNISTRQLQDFSSEPVEIIAPADPPGKPRQNLLMTLLPTILSVGVMVAVRSMVSGSMGGKSMIYMTIAMGTVTLLTSVLTLIFQRRDYRKNLHNWKTQYEGYIRRVIGSIRERQTNNAVVLDKKYPGAVRLLDEVQELNEDVFSRAPVHPDFMSFRLGNSDEVENLFEIKGSGREAVFCPAVFSLLNHEVLLEVLEGEEEELDMQENADSYIYNLPGKLAEVYGHMKDAPFLYSLRSCGALGIVYNNENEQKIMRGGVVDLFIRRMIFELSYYHSPENLQFVIFFPETSREAEINAYMSLYAHLPHCRELFENRSQFVFSHAAAGGVLGNLMKIMEERAQSGERNAPVPHIVLILFEEYNLKEHAFAAFLPEAPEEGKPYQNHLGITFVFAKRYKEYLPGFCNDVITLDNRPDGTCTIAPYRTVIPAAQRDESVFARKFRCGLLAQSDPFVEARSFRMLSAIYYTRISENRQVPSSVSLFRQFKMSTKPDETGKNVPVMTRIEQNWGYDDDNKRLFDVTKTLAVPIGKTGPSDEGDDAILDLHERADGPHMLVAGTTGSGKSETIISYLIGLCIRYRPDEVNMMLVDMKGGGFTKRLGMLPHVVGKVSDIDGDENNTGAEYMLKRFLVAIKAEVKRRKMLIGHFPNVDSIDGYIQKCRELKASKDTSAEDLEYIRNNPLTHLLLVVDEFTELKRFSSDNNDIDYMGEITTIARIGRSLGIHIILISQNIEGAITDDIRVNSKSRLCLKVATRQASKEMIGNDLAASPSMPGNGRAYLLVGTGSKFIYFQSAYSGVLATENDSSDLVVTHVEKEGPYTQFYNSREDKDEEKTEEKKNGQNQYNADLQNVWVGKPADMPVPEPVKEDDKKNQLQATVEAICELYEKKLQAKEISPKRDIFSDPLPTSVVYKRSEQD